jgi:hypothetical protein
MQMQSVVSNIHSIPSSCVVLRSVVFFHSILQCCTRLSTSRFLSLLPCLLSSLPLPLPPSPPPLASSQLPPSPLRSSPRPHVLRQ